MTTFSAIRFTSGHHATGDRTVTIFTQQRLFMKALPVINNIVRPQGSRPGRSPIPSSHPPIHPFVVGDATPNIKGGGL